ncbi:MAG: glycosyltransferase family 2 protein [Sedimentisphaerales bacterium]
MFISIIIPMRNEENFIGRCLDSFLCQVQVGENLEIVCVDGMSTDRTRDIVRQYGGRDKRIRLIENPDRFTAAGMNLGIVQSRGDFIIVASCHAKYSPNYVSKCLEVIQRTGAEHVGGYMTTLQGRDTRVGRAIATATSCRFGVGNAAFRLGGQEREVDTLAFGMYRRSVFEKVGLYDERLIRNQDIELNSRIRKRGGRIVISPEIKLSYYNRATYRGLWQQSFNNALWNPYTIWLVGRGPTFRHFIPMFFVSGLITFIIGAFFWWPLKWILFGYVLLYLSVACVFSIKRTRQTKISATLVLWSFVVLHMAYGLGEIWSIITIPFKFPNRHKQKVGKLPAD